MAQVFGRFIYRGTTVGWPGNPVLQRLGYTCTTVDPLVATLFALEAANFGDAVVLACPLQDVGAMLLPGNVFADLESEVVVSVSPAEFERLATIRMPVKHAHEVLRQLGFELPLVVTGKRALHMRLGEHERLQPDQVAAFEQLALGESL